MDSIELSSRGETQRQTQTQTQTQPENSQSQEQAQEQRQPTPPKTTTWTTLTTRAIRTTMSTIHFVRAWWAANIRPVVTVEEGSQTQRDYLCEMCLSLVLNKYLAIWKLDLILLRSAGFWLIPALERTYLSYIRTSNAIVTFAVLTTQLFIVRSRAGRRHGHGHCHDPHLKKSKRCTAITAGKSLACISIVVAIITVLAGTRRYFRQQEMILRRGRFPARGLDLMLLIWLYAVVSFSFFLLLSREIESRAVARVFLFFFLPFVVFFYTRR